MNVDLKQKSVLKGSILNFIKTFINVLFPVISFAYASRILGAEGIGKVNFANSIAVYFTLIATLGITNYGIRETSKLRDNKTALSQFTQEILLINGTTTFFSILLLLMCVTYISKLAEYKCIILVFSISIMLNGIGLEWLYGGLEEYEYVTRRTIIFKLIALAFLISFVKNENDLMQYALVNVLANSGSFVLNFFAGRKYVSFKKVAPYNLRRHIKPIFLLFALTLSIELYTCLDTTMLGVLSNDRAVGLYTAAVKINRLVNTVISSFCIVLIPRLSYYIEKKEKNEFDKLVNIAFQFIFLISIPASGGLFLVANEVIPLISGNNFSEAITTMKILVGIVLVIPYSTLVNMQILIPLKQEKYILRSTCIGAITNFSLNFALVPKFAQNGAAIATVIAETMVAIVCTINLKKFIPLKPVFKNIFQYFEGTLLFMIIIGLIHWNEGIFSCMAKIALALIIYFIWLSSRKNECLIMIKERLFRKLH